MTHPSLISRITKYAKDRPTQWISGGQYEGLAMEAGFKASNCSRRLRELHTAGILERKEMNGHVWYRYANYIKVPKDWMDNANFEVKVQVEPQEPKKQEQLTLRI